jgi:signal transduction histidine kinase
MENQQSNTEQKLLTIMKYAPIGLAEIDQSGSVSVLNIKGAELLKPLADTFGFNSSQLFPFLDFINPSIAQRIVGFAQPGGVILINELHQFIIPTSEGDVKKFFSITATQMYPGCIIVSFEDFTDKHVKEVAMRQSEVDRAVEQGKFEIASGVLHDIGNAVVGFGSYLTRVRRMQEQTNIESLGNLAAFLTTHQPAIAGAIGEEKAAAVVMMLNGIVNNQRASNDEIKKSITEQLNIITHIQDILNIQRQYVSGNETQERKPVNLRSIVNDCMAMLFASFDKRGIDVAINIPTDLPVLKGDRTKLMQVILNVLKNSLEAIDINAIEKKITVTVTPEHQYLLLTIQDTGVGFDEETGSKLFDRGFTTKSSGSGIGLYNCRKILESHNASMQITSKGPGQGSVTTMQFSL